MIRFLIFLSLALGVGFYSLASHYDGEPATTTFADRSGKMIGTLHPLNQGFQIWTPLGQIPSPLIEKILQAEDRYFYYHPGINPLALLRAAFTNLKGGRIVSGGSTITQQLAKNLIQEKQGVFQERNFKNKIIETLLAFGLELKHSKRWILERYLNTIYFGHRSYGVGAAAFTYFGKNVSFLSPQEMEQLVKIPPAPSRFHPLASYRLPSYGRHAMEYISKKIPPSSFIQTTLDGTLQKKLEEGVREILEKRREEDPLLNAAVVVIDVPTGEMLALVGSVDYFDEKSQGQVNYAQTLRQPGSALKPFTYLAAFAHGYTPESKVVDGPVNFTIPGDEEALTYMPQNFDRKFHGEMTLREALANSYNVPATLLLNDVGLSFYHALLKKAGFTSFNQPPSHYGLALTLGSGEVSLLELTNAYAALARGGMALPLQLIKNAKEGKEVPLLDFPSLPVTWVTEILSDPKARVKAFGFNSSLALEDHDVAVKTGTSYNQRDNWALGYNSRYAVGVWVGHPDGSPLSTTGASGAAPVWHLAMETLLRGSEEPKITKTLLTPPHVEPLKKEILSQSSTWFLASPMEGTRFRLKPYLPREHQKIFAQVLGSAPQDMEWYLDGEKLGVTHQNHRYWIEAGEGRHELIVSSLGQREQIHFYVTEE